MKQPNALVACALVSRGLTACALLAISAVLQRNHHRLSIPP